MTVREALRRATALLGAQSTSPSLDAALLLSHKLAISRTRLLADYNWVIPPDQLDDFFEAINQRKSGLCVAYITGKKEFRSLNFSVTQDVLVPRPETETLVEAAISWLDSRHQPVLKVLDLCTGSGCVAISIKHERPQHQLSAADQSAAALQVAQANTVNLLGSLGTEIDFYLSDLMAAVPGSFDLIVANPPYIPSPVIDSLAPEVRHEPRLALDGGPDGLDLYRRLIPEAFQRLKPTGALLLEIGDGLSQAVYWLLTSAGFINLFSLADLSGTVRVVRGSRS